MSINSILNSTEYFRNISMAFKSDDLFLVNRGPQSFKMTGQELLNLINNPTLDGTPLAGPAGPAGPIGPKIDHNWVDDTKLSLENPNGSYDTAVQLKGATGLTGATGLQGDGLRVVGQTDASSKIGTVAYPGASNDGPNNNGDNVTYPVTLGDTYVNNDSNAAAAGGGVMWIAATDIANNGANNTAENWIELVAVGEKGETGPARAYDWVDDSEKKDFAWANDNGTFTDYHNLQGATGAKGADLKFDDLTDAEKGQLKGDQGDDGPQGPKGDMPSHSWNGTELSFENPDGSYGDSVDLKGEKGDRGEPGKVEGAVPDSGSEIYTRTTDNWVEFRTKSPIEYLRSGNVQTTIGLQYAAAAGLMVNSSGQLAVNIGEGLEFKGGAITAQAQELTGDNIKDEIAVNIQSFMPSVSFVPGSEGYKKNIYGSDSADSILRDVKPLRFKHKIPHRANILVIYTNMMTSSTPMGGEAYGSDGPANKNQWFRANAGYEVTSDDGRNFLMQSSNNDKAGYKLFHTTISHKTNNSSNGDTNFAHQQDKTRIDLAFIDRKVVNNSDDGYSTFNVDYKMTTWAHKGQQHFEIFGGWKQIITPYYSPNRNNTCRADGPHRL